ncbi:myrosinase 1-like [Trichoplusia ni]|uniref:Myrosinase 1-like n=1 Tax=Trichoplusia ni TaxID=7111 RepID=A0A7E5VHD6_TRINI|nr:myrosinase 1-like [Trichoplusia ni]
MSCASVVVYFVVLVSPINCENLTFPPWFLFGAATSAYQIEGGWNASDKGESIWDKVLHTHPEIVGDGSNGDVACDSYHLWRRDIQMCEELGLDKYRFSISWSRLLPSGYPNIISEDGKNYYNNLIDGLLEKGIEPVVTMYHWDLPQYLQDLGGWANPLISDWFADYATVLYSLYADRVKYWITFNEPIATCDNGYSKRSAPYLDDLKIGGFLCNKNLLIAHAKAYRIYEESYKLKYNGKISLANIFVWFEPETPDDATVTELMIQLYEGRFAHPIYLGGWPPELEKILAENSKREGYKYPRLPPFTPEEVELVRGTSDYYALNHYFTRLIRKVIPEEAGSWPFYGSDEIGATMLNDPTWAPTFLDWFALNPKGLRTQLHWINATYRVSEIMITENGLPLLTKDLYDIARLEYLRDHLEQVPMLEQTNFKSKFNNGFCNPTNLFFYCPFVPIPKPYLFLSFSAKYFLRDLPYLLYIFRSTYGLYAVDFADPQRTRTPRESARYYFSVTKARSLQPRRKGLNYE